MTKKERNLYKVVKAKRDNAFEVARIFEKDGKKDIAERFYTEANDFNTVLMLIEDKRHMCDVAKIFSLELE